MDYSIGMVNHIQPQTGIRMPSHQLWEEMENTIQYGITSINFMQYKMLPFGYHVHQMYPGVALMK